MAVVWKEALCLGEHRDRYGRRLKFDRPYLREFHANAARLLSRGVPVPCVWEHQAVDAGSPAARLAAYAKYTFGHLAGVRFNDRGNVDLGLEVPDPADRQQLAKTRFVSPKILNGFRDSAGGVYRGPVVGHLAATPTPVQFGQRPFQLSKGQTLYLSFTPEGSTVADDADKGGDKGGAGKGTGGDLSALIDALREKGMTIPDEVSDIPGLIIAVKAGAGSGGGDADLDNDDDVDLDGDTAAAPGGGGAPMLMSDDRARPLVRGEKKALKLRVRDAFQTGRIVRPTAEKLFAKIDAVELSFTREAELVPNKLVTQIDAIEKLGEWTAWKKTGEAKGTELSDGRTVAVPRPDHGGKKAPEPTDVKEATDFVLQFVPGGPPPKKPAA